MARIVIANDSAETRFALRMVFERAGHSVYDAVDCADALAICKANSPDILICDPYMSIKEGTDTIKELRSQGACGKIIALIDTPAKPNERSPAVTIAGADETFAMPFRLRDLVTAAERLAAMKAPTRPPVRAAGPKI